MNIYIVGILIGLIVYLAIGFWAGKKVKSVDDYYVSGRNATTFFITGTMFASMLSTNGFMGDAGYAYAGNLTTLFLINTLCACGYIIGPLYFGRYIRRVQANTMPSYFAKRFNSPRIGRLAGIITIFSLTAYLISVISGTATLMQTLLELDRVLCLFVAWIFIVAFTIYSGSRGVIIVDTTMCICFLFSTLLVGYFVFENVGGVTNLVSNLAANPNTPQDLLTYHGNTGGGSVFDIMMYGITVGIIWMITVAVSPWQAGRNLMAKNEHVIFRSGVLSAILTIFFLLFVYVVAISVILINPNMPNPEQVIIWVASNESIVPKFIGVFLLTGILSAGLSSATTFLSVVSFSLANDVFDMKFQSEKSQISFTRYVVFAVSLFALLIASLELASMRIIAWFASTIIAASWGYVAFASVWSKNLNENGAYWAMFGGFVGYLVAKILAQVFGLPFKNFFDPFFVGIFISVICAMVANSGAKQSKEEFEFVKILKTIPQSEKSLKDYKIDRAYAYLLMFSGVAITAVLIYFWAYPYAVASGKF